MDRKKRRDTHNNPDFISGIFNYCDAWCEHCPFTSRCAVFAMEEADYEGDSRDKENGAFWKNLDESAGDAKETAEIEAEIEGLDLDAFEMAKIAAEEQEIDDAVQAHALHISSRLYMDKTHTWLKGVDGLFQGKARDPDRDDIVDIIGWYHTQIHVKLDRALHGEERGVPDIIADMPKDSDGSAKVALIGMDRSLAAWSRLKKHIPECEDEILEFLILLERLRRATERTFLKARSFVRPGFDEK